MDATAKPQTPRPERIRCVVIQLARLGDTLQSLMALRAAKQLYPELEIHFVAREKFAAAAQRVPWIESVTVLPTEGLLAPILLGKKRESSGLADLARWLRPLVSSHWDLVINWSYSEASSYLTGLIPGRVKLGYTRRKDLGFIAADGWSQYFQSIVQSDFAQNIHLTDILTTQLLTALQIHAGEPRNDGNAPATSKSFFKLQMPANSSAGELDPSRKWLGIQVATGSEQKNWPAASFAKLIAIALERAPDISVVLLGTGGDAPIAESILAQLEADHPKFKKSQRVQNRVGAIAFDQWAAIVSKCHWLVAGDTSAVHLASVLGTRVINLSVGPVRYLETGPYGNGHYLIAPDAPCLACQRKDAAVGHTCHEDVTPETVAGVFLYASQEWLHRRKVGLDEHLRRLGLAQGLPRARVLRSRIRSSQDGGGVVYENTLRRSLPMDQWFSQVLGHSARAWYCGWVPTLGKELTREQIGPELIKGLRELNDSADVLTKILREAQQTSAQLAHRSSGLRSEKVMPLGEKAEIQKLAERLSELDQLVERVGQACAPMRAYHHLLKVLQHNLRGGSLADLGRESADAYKQVLDGTTILKEWIQHTLRMARPVALATPIARLEEFAP